MNLFASTPPQSTFLNNKLSKAREFERAVLRIKDKDFPIARKKDNTILNLGNRNLNGQDHVHDDEEEDEVCTSRFWWWDPPKESVPKEFLLHSSMHGLGYLAMKKLNTAERIFWLVMFLCGVVASAILINHVWENYQTSPVIVTFSPKELDTNFLPFPAVTICDVNKIPKSKAEAIINQVKEDCGYDLDDEYGAKCNESKRNYQYLRSLCNSRKSFSSNFGYSAHQYDLSLYNHSEALMQSTVDDESDILLFLMRESFPCDQMLRLCVWSSESTTNCSTLFRPILTENGKCCTFNSLPPELLYKYSYGQRRKIRNEDNTLTHYWSTEEIEEWKKWDYNTNGFVINDPNITYPRRQVLPGIGYGLSILVDGNTDEYFCRSSDAEGMKILVHNPLEKPQMDQFGMTIPLGKLVKLEVSPDLTEADLAIAEYGFVKRQCYFGRDKPLRYFNSYTTLNCIDECIANETLSNCSCVYFYMPRDPKYSRLCSSNPDSKDVRCVNLVMKKLIPIIRERCKQCDTLCEDISYGFSMTTGDLRNSSAIWNDFDPAITNSSEAPPWANSTVSIVHIFVDSITTTPKLRAALYSPIDLIASVGGLLGLCLGFSVLSAVEVLYFFTCRFCFQKLRREKIGKKGAKKFINAVQKSVVSSKLFNNRIITLDRGTVPVYPAYSTTASLKQNRIIHDRHIHFE